MTPRRVLIIMRYLPQWRADFLNGLRDRLAKHGIVLDVVHGRHRDGNAQKGDEVRISWAEFRDSVSVSLFGHAIVWQPFLKKAVTYDLVIVEQANRLLLNFCLMLLRRVTSLKMAFWGHGLNLQIDSHSVRNRFKRLYITQCDWWFAYTEGVKRFLLGSGYPERQTTVVQNAIDTRLLRQQGAAMTPESIAQVRSEIHWQGGPVGLYCGGLYAEKRLEFLIAACDEIRKTIPAFELIVIGDGPGKSVIDHARISRPWLHLVGSKFGADRVPYFKAAQVFLMPGLVGLAILDTFALEIPLVTTRNAFHSPEIEYLQNEENGIMTDDSLESYVSGVLRVLTDATFRSHLVSGCREGSERYTVEQMVDRFADGITRAIGQSS